MAAFATAVQIIVWLLMGIFRAHLDGPWWLWTPGPAAMAWAHGPIAHLWIAMFFLGFARAAQQLTPAAPPMAPRWTLCGARVVAAINLLATPSLYFGMDATHCYAVDGWGADALVGLITPVWIGFTGLGIHRAHKNRAPMLT